MWKYYALGESEVEKIIMENEKQEQQEAAQREVRAKDVQIERSKGILESLIHETKSQLQSTIAKEPQLGNNEYKPTSKEAVQRAAYERLETLEELIREFNDSYHSSKNAAVEDILSKPDYFETMKTSFFKSVGLDSSEKIDNTTETSTDLSAKSGEEDGTDKKP